MLAVETFILESVGSRRNISDNKRDGPDIFMISAVENLQWKIDSDCFIGNIRSQKGRKAATLMATATNSLINVKVQTKDLVKTFSQKSPLFVFDVGFFL